MINVGPVSQIFTRAREVTGVVAVLCECMGGYREGDASHVRLHTQHENVDLREIKAA